MDENNSISTTQALNHIQSWFNAGEYDKVIQGCAEILELEPGNPRALALMKMAEERRHAETVDPLANLQVEDRSQEAPRPTLDPKPEPIPARETSNESVDKRKLFLAMLLPALVVVLLGGGLIWYLAARDRDDTIADNSSTDVTNVVKDTGYLDENEDRVADMTAMAKIIEEYRQKKGQYPDADELERVLVESDEFSSVPVDPRQGDEDAEGKPFGYMYAVYDSKFGKSNQYYILSALFEDSQGVGYEWNVGESVKNYDDYRDIAADNVTFVGSSK